MAARSTRIQIGILSATDDENEYLADQALQLLLDPIWLNENFCPTKGPEPETRVCRELDGKPFEIEFIKRGFWSRTREDFLAKAQESGFQAMILVYNISRLDSFKKLQELANQLFASKKHTAPLFVWGAFVGQRTALEHSRAVSTEEVATWVQQQPRILGFLGEIHGNHAKQEGGEEVINTLLKTITPLLATDSQKEETHCSIS